MKRAKKRKGGLRIETQFTFNQFEEFEGSTKGYRGKREKKCKREEGGSKSREKGKTVYRVFQPVVGIFLMLPREFSRM